MFSICSWFLLICEQFGNSKLFFFSFALQSFQMLARFGVDRAKTSRRWVGYFDCGISQFSTGWGFIFLYVYMRRVPVFGTFSYVIS